MKNIRKLVGPILLFILLAGCSSQPEFMPYEGRDLSIAVVGEAPDVEEQQVEFAEISFEEFEETALWKYDAVFIMEEHLAEAAESEYASVYTGVHIPFFFMESDKDHQPFIDPDLSYEEAREISTDAYATSFRQAPSDDGFAMSRYYLHNDEKTEEHIQALYSQIFGSIETSDGDQ